MYKKRKEPTGIIRPKSWKRNKRSRRKKPRRKTHTKKNKFGSIKMKRMNMKKGDIEGNGNTYDEIKKKPYASPYFW